MTEAEARAAVVAEALTWERTPYHARAKIRGVGVDCAMFPAAVYAACSLIPALDPDYSPQWMLHRDEEVFLSFVTPHAREIDRRELGAGDFAIWRFGRTYSHGAIVLDSPEVIHAVIRGGGVIRGNIDRDVELVSRPVRFFSLWGR